MGKLSLRKGLPLVFALLLLSGCATLNTKYATDNQAVVEPSKSPIYTMYVIGDAGKSPMGGMNPVLQQFQKRLQDASKNSAVVFVGDNIYPNGFPGKKEDPQGYLEAKNNMDAQIKALEGYKGHAFFIPGNHDWYSGGLEGLKREEDYIEEHLGKKAFYPKDGCPIKTLEVSDQVVVIAIDTEWYLTDWDKHPGINGECDIKDRETFFEEIESLIKKNRDKTTILALHHPMFSDGAHGGQFSWEQQLYPSHSRVPLPVLGSVINFLRRTSGASIEDLNNEKYRELRNRLVTLAQYSEKVVFVSGHEHGLQYIERNNVPQIVSGAGSKSSATRLLPGSRFSTGQMGYAQFNVYADGSSQVTYYGATEAGEEVLFETQVLPADLGKGAPQYNNSFPKTVKTSVYRPEEVDKTGVHRALWGKRYRKYYGTQVEVPTVALDTLYGGLEPVRKGGGHQSRSLRLRDHDGHEYVMRALRKSAEMYLQSMAFKDQYVVGDFKNTYPEALLSDFYTGSHPYAPFTIGPLSDAVGVYHTNPKLFYVPKQNALGDFNAEFGDELYMIEEHVSNENKKVASFGSPDDIVGTDELLEHLRKDEKYHVDETLYLRSRLFDMLIGDWDRHTDQWRWGVFKESKDSIVYRPIPRDRDQAFSIMGDGLLMGFATRAVPSLKLMEGFHKKIRSVKGFNSSPKTFALDLALLPETRLDQWEEQARYIQKHLDAATIDAAFAAFPPEVRDSTVAHIKEVLLARKSHLVETAQKYYALINKFGIVAGTDKDDYFTLTLMSDGTTKVVGQRIKKGEKDEVFFNKTFDRHFTKEIWIYGLDDKDVFDISGKYNGIKIRLVGGINNDEYTIRQGRGIHIYDFKTKKNQYNDAFEAHIHRTNDYATNTYQFSKIKSSNNLWMPSLGYNPDDGVRLGLSNTYTYNGFRQNPFTQQHRIKGEYYFATKGFDLQYTGEFANIWDQWNLELGARLTSSNFSQNFFGLGNETENLDDDLGMDYNRVRIEMKRLAPALVWRGYLGAKVKLGVSVEQMEVEETYDRFVNTFYQENGEENRNTFVGTEAQYEYRNQDSKAFPTLGMAASLKVGYKANVTETGNEYGYVVPALSFDQKLVSNGRLVLATRAQAHFNLGNGYEFFQAATLGGEGLRGYRFQRFAGKTSFYQGTDLRFSFNQQKTRVLPIYTGLFGGFDYGRVWQPGEHSDQWHTSYGGGLFINGLDVISAQLALFNSSDGPRMSFGVGFAF